MGGGKQHRAYLVATLQGEGTDMALEGMHHELLGHLQAKRAEDLLVRAWETAWQSAVLSPGTPLPCPECFLEGRASGLEPRRGVGNLGEARCASCRTVFVFSGG